MRIELITIGDELLDGIIADENARWLSEALVALGHQVKRCTTIRDDVSEIARTVKAVCKRSETCIVTGGLGPTADDVTFEAIAQAAGKPLETRADLVSRLRKKTKKKHVTDAVMRQSRIPKDAKIYVDDVGSAPSVSLTIDNCKVWVLPGVPKEMRTHAKAYVLPTMERSTVFLHHRVLRFTGIGESTLATQIESLNIDDVVHIGYRTYLPENHVRLRSVDRDALGLACRQIRERCKPYYVGADDIGLSQAVLNACRERNLMLGSAESCTGGMIGSALTAISGSSSVFNGSIVSYSNQAKKSLLGVQSEVLVTFGAVSEECAREMVQGALTALQCDIAVSVTGIAGPGGGSDDKPVGTVCFGWAHDGHVKTETVCFSGDRARIRMRALGHALYGIWRMLHES